MKKQSYQGNIYGARLIGILFLSAFVAYGLGRHWFEEGSVTEKYVGSMLIALNALIVLFIGIYLRKTLKQYSMWLGNVYLLTRIVEALALASVILNLLPSFDISLTLGYFVGMLVLGIGSIPMCWVLFRHALTPKWLALWGVVGYAIFAFGFLMELLGKPWSMYLLALAGLWECTFGIWLIIQGGFSRKTANN